MNRTFMYADRMLLKPGTLILCAGIAAGAEPRQEPKSYTPVAVENSTAYPLAPVSEMIPVAEPAVAPAAAKTIPEERRKKFEDQMRATGARFGVNVTEPIEWPAGTLDFAGYRSKEGKFLMLHFDLQNEITGICVSGSDLPDDGTKMVTPESFEEYARKCYRKAFGVLPVGELEFRWDGSGIKDRSDETARWFVSISGVAMKKAASVAASTDGRGQWTLSCTKGPTAGEVETLTRVLQTQPTRITEAEAVAIAWKNWKKVRAAPYTGNDFTLWCRLREVTQEEQQPWGEPVSSKTERLAWQNKTQEPGASDPVVYEVRINQSLFEINVLVDRQSGQVLRMNQGRMQW